jgi:hypothetical protein
LLGLPTLSGIFAVCCQLTCPNHVVASNAEDGAAIPPAIFLFEKLLQEQQLLRETIDRVGARQEAAFDRQARLLVAQRLEMTRSLQAQHYEEMAALQDYSRVTLVAGLAIAGLLLFAMAGLAWAALRAWQRLPVRVTSMPLRPLFGRDEAGLPVLPELGAERLMAQLEKRLLKLEEIAGKPAAALPSRTLPLRPSAGESSAQDAGFPPGDFL